MATFGEYAKTVGFFIPEKYRELIESIHVESKGEYRVGDVRKGFGEAVKLALSKYPGTIAYEYAKYCNERAILYDDTQFARILMEHYSRYTGTKPARDRAVLMLRIGDRLGRPGLWFIYRNMTSSIVVDEMRRQGLTKLTIVTAMFFGDCVPTVACKQLQFNLEILHELLDTLHRHGITDIELVSSCDPDRDLMYALGAKHLITTIGGFNKIVADFGLHKTHRSLLEVLSLATLVPINLRDRVLWKSHRGDNHRYAKCICVLGYDYGDAMHKILEIATKLDSAFNPNMLRDDMAVVGDTCIMFAYAGDRSLVDEARWVYADDVELVWMEDPTTMFLEPLRNVVPTREFVTDPFIELFRHAPFVFTKVPRTASTSIAMALKSALACTDTTTYWQHIPFSRYMRILSPAVFRMKYSFAIVRDVVDRFISAYCHVLDMADKLDRYYGEKRAIIERIVNGTFEDCVHYVASDLYEIGKHEAVFKPQADYFCDDSGKIIASELFPFEYLDDAIPIINTKIHLDIALGHFKPDGSEFRMAAEAALTPDLRAKIISMYANDDRIHASTTIQFIDNYKRK